MTLNKKKKNFIENSLTFNRSKINHEFSFSIGAISIARVSKVKETLQVLHVQPLSTKHFSLLSLADRVLSSEELTIIYPNIEKTAAMKKYETKKNRPKDGYVAAVIVMSITNNNGIHNLPNLDSQNKFLFEEQPGSSGNLEMPMSVDLSEDWCDDLMMDSENLPGFTDIWKNKN